MVWKWFLMLGALTCFIIGFWEAGEEGLLWIIMGWCLRIEFIMRYREEEDDRA